MGHYISEQQAERRLTRERLTRFYNLPEQRADSTQDIEGVEAVVHSYVGRRYAVPITDAAALPILRDVCLDLFEERAYRRGAGGEVPLKVVQAANAAMKLLHDLANGAATLAGATGLAEQNEGAEAILVDGNAPQFDRPNMEGF